MRHIAFVSVLLAGVASVASAQNNYVPAQNYNNPGVVVNMDVLQGGYGGNQVPNYRAPVLQQPLPPLRPPVLRQAAPAPRALPPAPMASVPAMPAPIQQEAAVLPPPIVASPKPAPIAAPAEMAKPIPPVAYRQDEPMKIAPYSTRALAAAAPPVAPPPSEAALTPPAVEDMPAPVPTPAPTKQASVNWDKASAPAAKKETAAAETKRDEEPSITANSEAELNKGEKQARQLLAHAREEADQGPEAERKVVLFDDMPPLPQAEMKTASVAKSSPPAMPAPMPMAAPLSDVKPAALAEVAPASIPSSAAVKKAETKIDDFQAYRLMFDAQSANLKPTEREILDNVAAKLKGDENVRLQLRAYANGTPDTTAQARRLSLSRALAVRSYLVEQGIVASRLDVRALGSGSAVMGDSVADASAPADRVDMVLVR